MEIQLIDSHCHLDLFNKEGRLNSILDEAAKAGVEQMIAVGTEQSDWAVYSDLANKFKDKIFYTVGLHPGCIEDDWKNQVSAIEAYFKKPMKPVALGEIGLDYFRLPTKKNPAEAERIKLVQKEVFQLQLDLASEQQCPVVIHTRDSFDDTLEEINKSRVSWDNIVFHCFTYGKEEMVQLLELGGRASFTGVITYKNAKSVREAALLQGVDRLMIETDCPYLTPVPHRGKENQPAFLKNTAEFCAELFECDIKHLAEVTSKNTREFYFSRK